jgi:hypothetical protein
VNDLMHPTIYRHLFQPTNLVLLRMRPGLK